MKNHSRVLSKLSLENIYKVKLASEGTQENFANFSYKIRDDIDIRTLGLSVSGGGGGANPLVPSTFESAPAAPSPTPLFQEKMCSWYI